MKCLIPAHPNRLEMERAYLQGKSVASIAREYGVGEESLRNHCQNNLSRQLTQAYAKKELNSSMDMLGEIDQIITRTKQIFQRNFDKGADVTALKALSEQRSTLELLCKISAYLHETKLLELQEAQAGQSRESESDYQAKLSVLTIPELEMLNRIVEKMESQNSKIIIIPESKSMGDSPTRRTKHTIYQPEEDNAVKPSKPTQVEDVEPEETEWQPRPGQKVSWVDGIPQMPLDSPFDLHVQRRKERERQSAMDDGSTLAEITRIKYGR